MIKSIIQNHIWELVDLSLRSKLLRSKVDLQEEDEG